MYNWQFNFCFLIWVELLHSTPHLNFLNEGSIRVFYNLPILILSNPYSSHLKTLNRFHSTFPISFPLLILMFTQVNSIIKDSCRKHVNFFMHQTKYLVNLRLYILSLRSINSMQDLEKTYKWAIMSIDFQVFCLEVDIYLVFFSREDYVIKWAIYAYEITT